MKINKLIITAALPAIVAIALIARAQDTGNDGPPGSGPRGHHHPPLPLVTALDTNHDGIIDAAEIANASAALLTLDANGDGMLTTNEYLPPLPKNAPANAHRPPTPLIVKALDANGDGIIDAAEIANAPAALKKLDKNGDGVLTRDEYIGVPPGRPEGGDGGEGNEAGGPPPDNGAGGPPPDNN
jgi:hypothetical protein